MVKKVKEFLRKTEWSKKFAGAIALSLGVYGIWCGMKYYELCELAIEYNSIMPDATLAVTSVSTVIASLMSYLLYQMGLKNSRNKYGIDADGQPFRRLPTDGEKLEEQIAEESNNANDEAVG